MLHASCFVVLVLSSSFTKGALKAKDKRDNERSKGSCRKPNNVRACYTSRSKTSMPMNYYRLCFRIEKYKILKSYEISNEAMPMKEGMMTNDFVSATTTLWMHELLQHSQHKLLGTGESLAWIYRQTWSATFSGSYLCCTDPNKIGRASCRERV